MRCCARPTTLHDRWLSLVADDKRKIAEAMVEKIVIGKA